MTKIWSDGEKVIITNPSGIKHVKENVDRVLGLGEFDKIIETKYSQTITAGKINPLARSVEIVGGHISSKIKEDLSAQLFKESVNGISDEDLVEKYFNSGGKDV